MPRKSQLFLLEVAFVGHLAAWMCAGVLLAAHHFNGLPITKDLVFHEVGKCVSTVGLLFVALGSVVYWFAEIIERDNRRKHRSVWLDEPESQPKIACNIPIEREEQEDTKYVM